MENKRKGMLIVISGPSGVGKGTLCKRLFQKHPNLRFSVSATTRAPREHEQDGVQYFFVTNKTFDQLIELDAFIEYAGVHQNRYGTLRSEVEPALEEGYDVLLDVDVQGGARVMQARPDCVSIFILPPSLGALRARLEGRGTESQEKIELRLRNAPGEIEQAPHYRYYVINDDLDVACGELDAIYTAEGLRVARGLPRVAAE